MKNVGTVEFGDWLNNELKREKLPSTPASESALKVKGARVATLKSGKKLLLEFLSLQEEMMRRAPG